MFKNQKTKKAFGITVNVLLAFFIVLILGFTVYAFNSRANGGIPSISGKSYLTVLSDSMNIRNETYDFDGFKRGDIVVIERYTWVEASNIQFEVGDIITFKDTDDDGNLFYNTHRIIEVHADDRYYITQGDVAAAAGQSTDPLLGYAEKVYFVEVVGSYQQTIRGLGNIMLFFQTPAGFLIFIVVPLIALFIMEIFNFKSAFVAYQKEKKVALGIVEKSTEELEKEIEELKAKLASKE